MYHLNDKPSYKTEKNIYEKSETLQYMTFVLTRNWKGLLVESIQINRPNWPFTRMDAKPCLDLQYLAENAFRFTTTLRR